MSGEKNKDPKDGKDGKDEKDAAAAQGSPLAGIPPTHPADRPAPELPEAGDYCLAECPRCRSTDSKAIDDPKANKSKGAWSRRECNNCGTTYKAALPTGECRGKAKA